MTSGLIPPPPGVTANFVDPPSQLQSNIALHAICLTLVTAAVGMRFYTRLFVTKTGLGLDDAFCALSYLLTVTFSGLMLDCYTLGIGRHMWDVDMPSFMAAVRIFTFSQYIYILLALFIRLTFLVFYYRLFSLPSPGYRYTLHGVIIFVVAMNLGLFFATLFNCSPREKNWDPHRPGALLPAEHPALVLGGVELADRHCRPHHPHTDPVGHEHGLWQEGEGHGCLWNCVCIASIVRMAMTKVLYTNPDRTWNISTIAIWATLEVNLGITCSCLMFLPAFLERHLPESTKSFISRLWGSFLGAIGKNTTGSSQSGEPSSPDHNTTYHHQYHNHHHHPFAEMKPSSSQISMQMTGTR